MVSSVNPIKSAIQFAKKSGSFLLRQSTDPHALLGYQAIGRELVTQLPQVTSIFVPVGSGATLLGISQSLPSSVKIFAVQSAANPTISQLLDSDFTPEPTLLTDALSVKYLPLKNRVLNAITGAFTVNNSSLLAASKYLTDNNIITSFEGALALAGYLKAKSKKAPTGDFPVILLTGSLR